MILIYHIVATNLKFGKLLCVFLLEKVVASCILLKILRRPIGLPPDI